MRYPPENETRQAALFITGVVGVLAAEFAGVFLLLRYTLEHWPCR